jgi:hypothetical protein
LNNAYFMNIAGPNKEPDMEQLVEQLKSMGFDEVIGAHQNKLLTSFFTRHIHVVDASNSSRLALMLSELD